MIKIVSSDWDFGMPTTRLVKVSSRGLRGNDLSDFIKVASHEFIDALDQLRPGEEPIHVIGVGAEEYYGHNRNGDGFSAQDCRDHHDTFRKHGHWYHDHINKDPRKSYGRIVKTAYNPAMYRVEMLVGLNSNEKAAKANGGLVATRDMEKLARGESIPVSMACTVAHDVCTECGNRARNRDEYCDTRTVKYAGRTIEPCKSFGCRHGLTNIAANGRVQGVNNPNPRWFDMSGVHHNADRIAFAFGMQKSASGEVPGGAALADLLGLSVPPELLMGAGTTPKSARRIKIALALAALERESAPSDFDYAFALAVREKVASFPDVDPDRIFRALADRRIMLSPYDWLHLSHSKEAAESVAADVAARLPGVYGRMTGRDDLGVELDDSRFDAAPSASHSTLHWAATLASTHGVDRHSAEKRAQLATIRGAQSPVAASDAPPLAEDDGGGAEKLAMEYAKYQIAFCDAVSEGRETPDSRMARTLLIRSNALG